MLDMGDPVKIVDLARNLILLSGLRPDTDIRIEFTGTRPGEKLYEELSHLDEGTVATPHHKVRAFAAHAIQLPDMRGLLEELRRGHEARDPYRVVLTLKDAIPDYTPSEYVLPRAKAAYDGGSGAYRDVHLISKGFRHGERQRGYEAARSISGHGRLVLLFAPSFSGQGGSRSGL